MLPPGSPFIGVRDNPAAALFFAARSPRGQGRDGLRTTPMTAGPVQKLIGRYVAALGIDPNVTVHSRSVTALTTAREQPGWVGSRRSTLLF